MAVRISHAHKQALQGDQKKLSCRLLSQVPRHLHLATEQRRYLAITRDLLMPVLRQALESDVKELSDLVCNSFVTLASADWSSAATEKLVADSSPEAMLTALKGSHFSKVALSNNQIVGMVLFSKPNVMKMLFVSPDMTRRGFGRLLWESARESVEKSEPTVSTIELNSTTFAIPFYKSIGFIPVSTKFEIEGATMTRMVCWLRARDFDAEL